MNLFFLSWRMSDELIPTVLSALGRITELYPQLDPDTLWYDHTKEEIFAASVHTAESAAEPRRYVVRDNDHITFYDGILVDRTGTFDAHRAEDLSAHWARLAESLEGRFAVVRASRSRPRIELLIDALGIEQVYYVRLGKAWLISNSIYLLEQVSSSRELDPLGVSLFLAMGWVGSDRTLRKDIRVFPGGIHLTWDLDEGSPSKKVYFSQRSLEKQSHAAFTPRKAEQLARSLTQMLGSLGQTFGVLNCPLSGGKDTRVMASLMRSQPSAKYWTYGDPSSTDVLIAKKIADDFQLNLHVNSTTTNDVIEQWDDLTRRLVLQTGGIVSLDLLSNLLEQPRKIDRLQLALHGAGGEIARSFYGDSYLFTHAFTAKRMLALFPQRCLIHNHEGLIEREATELAVSYIRSFLEGCLDDGFAVLNLPDLFYAFERVHRWASNYFWERAPTEDYFSPFCTRPFIEAAFSISALRRYSESIHYNLIRALEPKLFDLPIDKPWRSQAHPIVLLGKYAAGGIMRRVPFLAATFRSFTEAHGQIPMYVPMYDRAAWLEAKRGQIRDVCLSQPRSTAWNFVNRRVFEQLTSAATDPSERRRSMYPLFAIAAIFYHEMLSSERART